MKELNFKKMNKFKDNFSSESFYPDSNYYLDEDNTPKEDPNSKDNNIKMQSKGFTLKIKK